VKKFIHRVSNALRFFHDGWTQRDQLERANALLIQAEKMAVLGTYAGGVAHNIRNMIFPLISDLDSIRMDVEDAVEKKAADPIEELKACSQDIFERVQSGEERIMEVSDLIESIMALYRGNPKESEIFDLAPVIENAIRLEKTRKESKQIEFRFDKTGNDFTVEALKGSISSTIVEFLKNASYAIGKARPSGEGHIDIKLEETKDEKLGDVLRLSIKDDGCGMSDEVRKDIFIPLFTTKAGMGTGLGLSAAYQMIGQHSGCIEVESQEGKGATFTVTLPKRQKEKITVPVAAPKTGA
jgi:signal transduction histidine kinase